MLPTCVWSSRPLGAAGSRWPLLGRQLGALVFASLLVASACRGGATRHPDVATTLRIVVPEADRDADVFVDGNYVGQVEAMNAATAPIRLGAGKHRIEVRKPGRFPVQRTVEVTAETPDVLEVPAELLSDPR